MIDNEVLAGQVSATAPAPRDSDTLPAYILHSYCFFAADQINTTALQAVLTEMLFEAHELLEEVQDSMPDDREEES